MPDINGPGRRKKRKLDGEMWPNAVVPYEFNNEHPYPGKSF